MIVTEKGAGAITAVMNRLHKYRLPRIMEIKETLDRGDALDEWSAAYLTRVIGEAQHVTSMVSKYPKYHALYGRLATFYRQITDQALENAKRAQNSN